MGIFGDCYDLDKTSDASYCEEKIRKGQRSENSNGYERSRAL